MILLMGNKQDALLLQIRDTLSSMKVNCVLVYAEELIFAKKWTHTLSKSGDCFTEIIIPNNKIINSNEIRCIYNRIGYLQAEHFSNNTDRMYAGAEFSALYISFLKSMEKKTINPIQTSFLAVGMPTHFMYKIKAIEYGIPVTNEMFTSSPKWENDHTLIPYEPAPLYNNPLLKKAPHLLLSNLPTLLKEKEDNAFKVYFANDTVFTPIKISLTNQIKAFAKAMKRDFIEFTFVETNNTFKLKQINDFPLSLPAEMVHALGLTIIKKSNT
jgi:hypothetical protein